MTEEDPGLAPLRRLAVLGSPIAHSLSPRLHSAAYRVLGLDWEYGRAEVATGGLGAFLEGLDDSWRGLSLTMPLKREILPLLGEQDETTALVGAANTVLFDEGRILGFNTDVHGAEAAISEAGAAGARHVVLLGAGATAASVLTALARLGVARVSVLTRSPGRAGELFALAEGLEPEVSIAGLEALPHAADAVVSTLPGTAGLVRDFPAELRASAPLIDVAYDPWPTPLARHWLQAGGAAHSGLCMLIHQAHAQVRVFVGGDAGRPLERDAQVLAALRRAAVAGERERGA